MNSIFPAELFTSVLKLFIVTNTGTFVQRIALDAGYAITEKFMDANALIQTMIVKLV